MAFDLATAKPFDLNTATEVKQSGFDLTSAKPVEETSLLEDIKISAAGAGETLDRFGTGLEIALKNLYDKDAAEKAYNELQDRNKKRQQFANPDNKKQSFGGKVAGTVSTLPLQLLTFPFSPATTGQTMLEQDESLGSAVGGTLVDTLGNIAGVALPGATGVTIPGKAVSGALINAGQDVLTRSAIAALANKQSTKDLLGPSVENAALSAIIGAGLGPLSPSKKNQKVVDDPNKRLNNIKPLVDSPSKSLDNSIEFTKTDGPPYGLADAPYKYEGGIDPDSTLGGPVKQTFDPRQVADNPELAKAMLEDIKALDPKMFEELALSHNAEAITRVWDNLQQQAELQKRGQVEAMWNERDASLEQRAQARQDQESLVDALTKLEEEPLRESKGQQRKSSIRRGRGPARGGISPELLTFGLSNLINKPTPPFLKDILDTKLYAETVSGDDVVKAALAEGPEKPANALTRATTNLGAGGTMEAAKRNSTAVLGASRIIQRAKNIAEDKVRTVVFPVENHLRQAKKSIEHLASFLKREQVGKALLGEKALADEGADLKAIAAYSQLRNMQKVTGEYINEILSSLGKRNIDIDPAYMTSIWRGDFKTIFYREIADSDGVVKNKPVAVLSAETKQGLKTQVEAFKKQNPDLANLKTEDASIKGPGKQGTEYTRIFNTMLEVLGENDPAMQKVAAWAEMNTEMQGKKMLGEEKHFIPKTGVMGYIGDRPANTIFGGLNNKKEAIAYLQAQVDVAKAAYQWGEMQKAAQEMKKIINNEELAAQQPHNMRFINDYWLDNLGMSDSAVARTIDDQVLRKWAGVSPGSVSNVINHIKSFWISQKILGAPYYIANIIQSANMIPHLTDIAVKWGGNPLYAIPSGFMDGMITAFGHMAHTMKGSDDIKPNVYRIASQGGMSEFSIKAMKYAEDNSVTTRSIYDEAPIESSMGVFGQPKRIATNLISLPETFLRSVAYMTYAHMLKTSGKFTNDMDIFRMAEERVNQSMGDYRTGERALMFGKTGTVGTALNTLTTFPMNYFNNWSWAAREAGRGNALPFVAMFATQFLAAGAMGIPGFADMDKLWEWIKDSQKDNPKTWDKIKDIDLQELARSFGGDLGLYGLPSVLTDTALTSRAAAPLGSEMVQTPGAPFADLAQQGASVLSAVMDPINTQKTGQALYNISPPLTQGLFETTILRDMVSNPNPDGTRTYMNPRNMSDREGMVDRGPREEKLRKLGLRSLDEQKELDLVYKARKKNTDSRDVGQNAMKEAYNAARLGNKEKAREYINLYVKLTGSQNPDIEALVKKEFMTRAQRAPETLTTPAGMRAVKIMNEILQEEKP